MQVKTGIWVWVVCMMHTLSLEAKTLKELGNTAKTAAAEANSAPFDQLQTLTAEEVLEELKQSAKDVVEGDFELELTHHPLPVDVPVKEPLNYTIADFKLNQRQNRFSATLEFEDKELPPMALQGKLTRMIEVPVLVHPIAGKQIIQEADLKWMKLPESQVSRFIITSSEGLVGSEPRGNGLSANIPIRSSEIQKPRAVARNAMITLRYTTENMHLESRGMALDEGELGATIRVKNTDSGKTLTGIITEAGVVDIAPQAPLKGDQAK